MTVLRIGSRGDDVRALQGALGIGADGEFGPQTKAAVEAFQKAHSLPVDGVVGSLTLAALGIAKPTPAAPPGQAAILTLDMLRRLWPRGDSKVPGLMAGIAASAPAVFEKYGLVSTLVVAHAMAQFSHECGAGQEMTESINYSAERAVQVWPTRFGSAASVYSRVGSFPGDPNFHTKLMDNVYGSRMGNRPGTHDGSMFIGRGLSQTTGREGYEKLSAETGLDLINHPDLVSTPANALECGVADFIICKCLAPAQHDDVNEVTHRLNGGYIGLVERKQWLTKWKLALGGK